MNMNESKIEFHILPLNGKHFLTDEANTIYFFPLFPKSDCICQQFSTHENHGALHQIQ